MASSREPASIAVGSACANCGFELERIDEYGLDIAGREVAFFADRCSHCGNEYVNAPDILRPDLELLTRFRPQASPLGTRRRIINISSRDRDFRGRGGPKVAGTLLGYLLKEDLADVVLLAHQSVSEEPAVAYTNKDLLGAGEIRMGSGRAVFTGSGLRANLLTLTQLKRFVESDGGLHPRIAVMGRPCQIYTIRKLLWDRFAPGYELAFALGIFCYGNFAPAAWGGKRLRELLGFDPAEIRQVEYTGEELRFTSASGDTKKVGQEDVAGLVNANCLQCYDFTVSFSDVSVGHIGPDELFETAILRTELGERIVDQAVHDGFLTTSSQMYGRADVAREEERTVGYLGAMVDIKRELTKKLR